MKAVICDLNGVICFTDKYHYIKYMGQKCDYRLSETSTTGWCFCFGSNFYCVCCCSRRPDGGLLELDSSLSWKVPQKYVWSNTIKIEYDCDYWLMNYEELLGGGSVTVTY
ncbi:hypothetical protein SAMN02910384_02588 [Pseudobutyrivibrio sp. ACV-2]|uniref:hypothetical protein n=1 Tax=Pseudobutyrivibrio sp. ACV-2 TaxID=1520801 RepID=UPI0008991375|nr:hypothetical protein [Pseudobutyrivibrio sp. ACV-2]SEA87699.1 hypothetical protein SAMN02910384_02588 [Pseudobutyrivibrio sp. ACV-2]